jgi:hypothetical protein
LREKLADLLEQTANALKGQPAPLHWHDWSDLPKVATQLKDEIETLKEFVAIIFCWKPEWAQTAYFQRLSEKQRIDLLELAKSTKHEGSGGIDNEWLDALLKRGECEHANAVSAINEVIQSGMYCPDCKCVFAGENDGRME